MFDVSIERDKSLVRVTVKQFFTPEAAMALSRALSRAYADVRTTTPHFDMLVIVGPVGPLPQEAVAGIEHTMHEQKRQGVRKSAFVAASAIARMQHKRMVGDDPRFRVFATEAEAKAWLAE